MSNLDLNALAVKAASGDEGARDEILIALRPLVTAISRRYYLTGGESEDLVQEGMIGLYGAINSFDPQKNNAFSAYAAVCINRRLCSAVKTANSQKNRPLSEGISLDEVAETAVADSAEDSFFLQQRAPILADARKKLSDEHNLVLDLYLDGYSYAEIAKRTGLTAKAVDNRLQYVKNILQKLLLKTELL